jgi:RNA polymerase sigma factor (TIGR02999 family)
LADEAPGQTLQATALVHEAYLRLVATEAQRWNSRGHFFAAAAEAMRRILVDRARKRGSVKHGGRVRRPLNETDVLAPEAGEDLIALDEALAELASRDAEAAELVKLRFFAGLTSAQAAEALRISPRTADRVWTYARTFLLAALQKSGA